MKWEEGTGEWSPDVRRESSRGLRRGKYERRSLADIKRIIIHHTGVGILSRFERQKARFGWLRPVEAAIHVYGKIMDSSGHYIVDYDGSIVQCVPDDFAAWHAGYGGARRRRGLADWFRRMRFSKRDKDDVPAWFNWQRGRYLWWKEKWFDTHGFTSPLEWFPDLNVNFDTLGIELLAVPGREQFRKAQLFGGPGGMGLLGLVRLLSSAYDVPIQPTYILTHSDATPTARTTKKGKPWDPPPSKYSFERVFAKLQR